MLYYLIAGSSQNWGHIPNEFQVDLATLERLEDEALWEIAQSHKTTSEMARYNALLERNQDHTLTEAERVELTSLRTEADRFMLRKAQATAILRWRNH